MKRIISLIWMLNLLVISAVSAWADEAPPPWKSSLELSYLQTSGNTTSQTLSAGLKVERTLSFAKLTLEGGALYGTKENVASDQSWFGSLKYDQTLSDRFYLFLLEMVERNTLRGFEFRYTHQGGLGYYLIKTEGDILKLEAGAGYVHEDQIDPFRDRGFPSGRAFAGYTHNFSKTSRFDEWVEYLSNLNDSKDYMINEETALITNLMGNLALKTSFDVTYDHLPPPGFEKSDRVFKTALLYTF
jgi:putative salt-induced outer membrane protein